MPGDQIQQIRERLEDHEKRILALENSLIDQGTRKMKVVKEHKDYSGATGGIRFLIKNGFFKVKRSQKDIRQELAAKNYHYSSQAIYAALQILSKPNGPLVVLKGKGHKVYVERK
jgi:hypothetical protein